MGTPDLVMVLAMSSNESTPSSVKPGIQSTEFWMAMFVVLAGTLASVYTDQQWAKVAGTLSATLMAMGYGFQRMRVKQPAVPRTQVNSVGGGPPIIIDNGTRKSDPIEKNTP